MTVYKRVPVYANVHIYIHACQGIISLRHCLWDIDLLGSPQSALAQLILLVQGKIII